MGQARKVAAEYRFDDFDFMRVRGLVETGASTSRLLDGRASNGAGDGGCGRGVADSHLADCEKGVAHRSRVLGELDTDSQRAVKLAFGHGRFVQHVARTARHFSLGEPAGFA